MRFGIPVLLILLFICCNSPTQRMAHFEVHGIDISHYQSTIQWDTIAGQDIDFAFVKATEGNDLRDSLYCFNWKEMKRVGIKRGAYHFFRPKLSIKNQVENFLEQVQLERGDLPPVLDVEVDGGLSKKELVAAVRDWLLQVEAAIEVRPIIYSNYNFYQRYLADDLAAYPVWIARYTSLTPYLNSETSWQFWQYGNRGRLAGIEGDVDFNVFHGSLEELNQLCIGQNIFLSQNDIIGLTNN